MPAGWQVADAYDSAAAPREATAAPACTPRWPRSALSQGADLVVQSTHKTLGALTQSAMLHASASAIGSAATTGSTTTGSTTTGSALQGGESDGGSEAAGACSGEGGAYRELIAAIPAALEIVQSSSPSCK